MRTKDTISLVLIFVVALTIESAAWVWLPALVAIALLQVEKIERILKNE